MPDGKRVSSVLRRESMERRHHPADPIHCLCVALAKRGWMVWHVAPPGEAVPDDGRAPLPAIHAERPQEMAAALGALKFLQEECGGAPVVLAREAVLGGCDALVTKIVGESVWWAITVRGNPSAELAERLRSARYQPGREDGLQRWYWTNAPPDPVRRGRAPTTAPSPRIAPAAAPSPAMPAEARAARGGLRLVPPLARQPSRATAPSDRTEETP